MPVRRFARRKKSSALPSVSGRRIGSTAKSKISVLPVWDSLRTHFGRAGISELISQLFKRFLFNAADIGTGNVKLLCDFSLRYRLIGHQTVS